MAGQLFFCTGNLNKYSVIFVVHYGKNLIEKERFALVHQNAKGYNEPIYAETEGWYGAGFGHRLSEF